MILLSAFICFMDGLTIRTVDTAPAEMPLCPLLAIPALTEALIHSEASRHSINFRPETHANIILNRRIVAVYSY